MSRLLLAACVAAAITTAIARRIPVWLQGFEDGLVLDLPTDTSWSEYWDGYARITS